MVQDHVETAREFASEIGSISKKTAIKDHLCVLPAKHMGRQAAPVLRSRQQVLPVNLQELFLGDVP